MNTETKHLNSLSGFCHLHNIQPRTRSWEKLWQKASVGVPTNLASSLEAADQKLFPNIYACLHLLYDNPSEYSSNYVQSLLPTICENKASINNGPE